MGTPSIAPLTPLPLTSYEKARASGGWPSFEVQSALPGGKNDPMRSGLHGLFDMPLPPPPPLSSSGLLRPFVPIVPLPVLIAQGRAGAIVAPSVKPPAPWKIRAFAAAAVFGFLAAAGFGVVAFRRMPVPVAPMSLVAVPRAEAPAATQAAPSYADLALALDSAEVPLPNAPAAAPEDDKPKAVANAAPTIDLSPLGRAEAALVKGDLSTANFAFGEAAGIPETQLDGLVGLGEVARRKGNYQGAIARYRAALAVAPRYFPALMGMADAYWESGDRATARSKYVAMQTEYSPRMLPARARDRAK